eukprot:NODE_156_length_16689_cov_0.273960.p12 type:complete len:109 gc:universal NODE_156_length_16689_cov_0.273960:3466-3792(+)
MSFISPLFFPNSKISFTSKDTLSMYLLGPQYNCNLDLQINSRICFCNESIKFNGLKVTTKNFNCLVSIGNFISVVCTMYNWLGLACFLTSDEKSEMNPFKSSSNRLAI